MDKDLTMSLSTLLNIPTDIKHHTVFVVDQPIEDSLQKQIRQALLPSKTQVHFARASENILADVYDRGIQVETDYVSLHCWATRFQSHQQSLKLLSQLRRFDFSRLEFPASEVLAYESKHLEDLVSTMLASNYKNQDRKFEEFYSLLSRKAPYEVAIHTGEGNILRVEDSAGWFQLGGSLVEGESRILPSGEVAYTGSKVSGRFTADGTLLAAPQRASVAGLARQLTDLRGELKSSPLTFAIEQGKITEIEGQGVLYDFLNCLLDNPSYRDVVEIGIGINSACRQFTESWPSPANEAHPGAHIAIGGDPDPNQPNREVAVHIDWMSECSQVFVNGEKFDCESTESEASA